MNIDEFNKELKTIGWRKECREFDKKYGHGLFSIRPQVTIHDLEGDKFKLDIGAKLQDGKYYALGAAIDLGDIDKSQRLIGSLVRALLTSIALIHSGEEVPE